jgi:hypothetical protein
MICPPCQLPHAETDCVDQQATPPRTGVYRHCYCQHRPRSAATPVGGLASAEGADK